MDMALSADEMLDMARALPIPAPWDRETFIANMAQKRGRPIRLIPHSTAVPYGSLCGLWLTRADDDLILYHSATSDYHIDHIVRHEIGHMVLGHCRSTDAPSADENKAHRLCHELLPDLDPASVLGVLGRQDYASPQEREAEVFANMIMIAAAEANERTSMFRSVFFRRQ
jgi:hypothetical protein